LPTKAELRRFYSEYEDDVIRRLYPDTKTERLALYLGRSVRATYNHAKLLGVRKSAAYLASEQASLLRRRPEIGEKRRFKPGHATWNKGIKHPQGWAPGRMAQTQFKKGCRPQTWKPLGTTRLSKDGYLQRKVGETGHASKDWVGEHILIWERAHGPVPKGHAIVFKDGDKTHIAEDNLALISRADLLRRNTVHNLPKELALVIQLAGALRRKVRALSEQTGKPKTGGEERLGDAL